MYEDIWPYIFLVLICVFSIFALATVGRRKLKAKQITNMIASVLIFSTILFVIIISPLFDQPRISDSIIFPIIGMALVLFGMVLCIVAGREINPKKMRLDSKGRSVPVKVISTGIYGYIRHPASLGFIFIFIGWPLFWAAVYSFLLLVVVAIYFVIDAFKEERYLLKMFGDK